VFVPFPNGDEMAARFVSTEPSISSKEGGKRMGRVPEFVELR